MKNRSRSQQNKIRSQLTQTTARIMVEGGLRDFRLAKRKATLQLGLGTKVPMPSNQEIEQAVLDYQNLFHNRHHQDTLRRLRETALHAMRFLDRFHPRLVGSVLTGTAAEHHAISINMFADPIEDIGLFLKSRDIPCESIQKRLRFDATSFSDVSAFRFVAEDAVIELIALPLSARRHPPLSTTDGKPDFGATAAQVGELVVSEAESPAG